MPGYMLYVCPRPRRQQNLFCFNLKQAAIFIIRPRPRWIFAEVKTVFAQFKFSFDRIPFVQFKLKPLALHVLVGCFVACFYCVCHMVSSVVLIGGVLAWLSPAVGRPPVSRFVKIILKQVKSKVKRNNENNSYQTKIIGFATNLIFNTLFA